MVGSEPWCARALDLSVSLPAQRGCGYRVQHEAVSVGGDSWRWYQVVDEGRVVAWAVDEVDDPDLELRWWYADIAALYRGELSGTAALAAVRLVGPGGREVPPPPLDLAGVAELDLLPVVAGARLEVQYELSSGPFGTVWFWMGFIDGQSSGMGFGLAKDPDVTVAISFSKMAAVRSGQITVLEALEDGGRVDGAVGPLMLLAGLEESEELHAAEVACGPAAGVLGSMGLMWATAEHELAMAELAQETR